MMCLPGPLLLHDVCVCLCVAMALQAAFEGMQVNGEGVAAAGGEGNGAAAAVRKAPRRPGRASVVKRYLQRGLGAAAQKVFLPMVAFRWVCWVWGVVLALLHVWGFGGRGARALGATAQRVFLSVVACRWALGFVMHVY